ncbi:MAG: hypothetical protein IJA72_04165 [Clostridia bacterium]|nr:hypothetical protein [Clostridia bacterium]
MSEYFEYIDENLEKIKNPNDVDIIKVAPHENKGYSLFARLNGGDAIRLTKPMGRMSIPYQPMLYLSHELGRFYWEDFAVLDDKAAINKNHLVRLMYVDMQLIEPKYKRVDLYAKFDDDNLIYIANPMRKFFFKKWKAEIEQKCGMQFEDITEEVRQQNELNQ